MATDYLKEYRSFISSHYLAEGVRITAGIVLPALLFSHWGWLQAGIVVSLGAMSVSITDNPGPVHHRKNGMLAALIINTIVALLTGFFALHTLTLAIWLLLACFVFSMAGVYGTRANSVGVSALLIIVLTIDRHHSGWELVWNAAYMLCGAAWYMLLSLVLHRFRPYKLAQQALGDCIIATADYLHARAAFYATDIDFDKAQHEMLEQQVVVHQKQELVRELLFKSRYIVKESTHTGRTLLVMFTDIVDLFERIMTSYHDYTLLRETFKEDDILERFREVILVIEEELHSIGIAVQSGTVSKDDGQLPEKVKVLKECFGTFRDEHRTATNLDAFISLRQVLSSIEDISNRIHTLHLYTSYDKELLKDRTLPQDYESFISHQSFDPKILRDNISFDSNTFRHAIRVSAATMAGLAASMFLPVGHSYWILLTIIVILKPAYSLTKKRNIQRLAGTVAGALIGLVFLQFVHSSDALFVIMLLLMIGTYSMLRTNYLLSIFFMTPYILLLFHLISNTGSSIIISDRIVDTAIGSVIAFVANLFVWPNWEKEQINRYMLEAIAGNEAYFMKVSEAFVNQLEVPADYKVKRKQAYVALANLSDAFTRMLNEPRRQQKKSPLLHQFVVLNHMLTSHIASLSYYTASREFAFNTADFVTLAAQIQHNLQRAVAILEAAHTPATTADDNRNAVQERLQHLLDLRRKELNAGIEDSAIRKALTAFKPLADQFTFIANIAADLVKSSENWVANQ